MALCRVRTPRPSRIMAIFLRRGMLTEADRLVPRRVHHRQSHKLVDRLVDVDARRVSLVGFYAWWGSKLLVGPTFQPGKPDLRSTVATSCCFASPHLATSSISVAKDCRFWCWSSARQRHWHSNGERFHPWDAAAFMSIERSFTLLSAGAANALYTVGGILLTLTTPNLPKWVRASMWATWLAGILMTIAGVMDHTRRPRRIDHHSLPTAHCLDRLDGRPLESAVKRIIVLGGLGHFGRATADQLRCARPFVDDCLAPRRHRYSSRCE